MSSQAVENFLALVRDKMNSNATDSVEKAVCDVMEEVGDDSGYTLQTATEAIRILKSKDHAKRRKLSTDSEDAPMPAPNLTAMSNNSASQPSISSQSISPDLIGGFQNLTATGASNNPASQPSNVSSQPLSVAAESDSWPSSLEEIPPSLPLHNMATEKKFVSWRNAITCMSRWVEQDCGVFCVMRDLPYHFDGWKQKVYFFWNWWSLSSSSCVGLDVQDWPSSVSVGCVFEWIFSLSIKLSFAFESTHSDKNKISPT